MIGAVERCFPAGRFPKLPQLLRLGEAEGLSTLEARGETLEAESTMGLGGHERDFDCLQETIRTEQSRGGRRSNMTSNLKRYDTCDIPPEAGEQGSPYLSAKLE
jgi:hypothetical protein